MKKFVRKILKLVKEEGLKLEQPIFLNETPRFKTEELEYLEKNIFNNRAHKYQDKVEFLLCGGLETNPLAVSKEKLDELNATLKLNNGQTADEMFVRKVEFCLSKTEGIEGKITAKQSENKIIQQQFPGVKVTKDFNDIINA